MYSLRIPGIRIWPNLGLAPSPNWSNLLYYRHGQKKQRRLLDVDMKYWLENFYWYFSWFPRHGLYHFSFFFHMKIGPFTRRRNDCTFHNPGSKEMPYSLKCKCLLDGPQVLRVRRDLTPSITFVIMRWGSILSLAFTMKEGRLKSDANCLKNIRIILFTCSSPKSFLMCTYCRSLN